MSLTLAILAAGVGSRYGGLKQLDAVGPSGETMLDFAVYDAARAGFDRLVFIIRRDIEAAFRAQIGAKYTGRFRVDYAFQAADSLPGGHVAPATRTKPWGTGHALWCAREVLDGPFVAINADDFYGRDSFAQLSDFLRATAASSSRRPRFASAGFRLAQTLSEHGSVSRGICGVGVNGALTSVVERTNIRAEEVGPGRLYSGDEIVSMNCWGFTPALFPALGRRLAAFLAKNGTDPKAEFYLPAAVSDLIAADEAEVQVLPTRARWLGVTYREDKPRVAAALLELTHAGDYPLAFTEAVQPALTT